MPTVSSVHQNKILENISVAHLQKPDVFKAGMIFPRIPVEKESDTYFIFSNADLLRDDAAVRPPLTESAGTDYSLSTASYQTLKYAIHMDVPDEAKTNQDGQLVDDQTVAQIITQKAAIRFERYFVQKFFTISLWTGSSTGTDLTASVKWDKGGSTPVKDVQTESDSILLKVGVRPNKIVVVPAVHKALKNNADILSRLSANERALINPSILAQIFEVDEYIVGEAVYNSATKGATQANTFIYGTDGVLLTYAAPTPSKLMPSGGYIFSSNAMNPSNNWGLTYKKIRLELLEGDRHEVQFKLDPKLVCADAGAFFTDVLS